MVISTGKPWYYRGNGWFTRVQHGAIRLLSNGYTIAYDYTLTHIDNIWFWMLWANTWNLICWRLLSNNWLFIYDKIYEEFTYSIEELV